MKKTILTFLFGFLCSFLVAQSAKDTLTTLSHFEFAYPYWSPDGKEIVFQSNLTGTWQLYKRDMTTKEIVRLMENKANEVTPAWSPDGTKILFTSDRDGDEEIFALHLKSKEVKQLTHNDSRDIHPNWSPDGKKIVFNSAGKQDNPEKLFIQIMNEDGSNINIIKEDENINSYASFSPDGKKITFLKWMDKGNNGEIFYMNADGTEEVRLTNNKVWDAWPTWSAKGDQVIFSSSSSGAFKLCSVDILTKRIIPLTFGEEEDARANCKRSGESIVFNRGASGKIDILVLKLKR